MKKNKLNFNKLFLSLLLVASPIIILQSCSDDNDYDDQKKLDNQLILDYLSEHNIEAEKAESGYYYEVLTANESGAEVGDEDIVSVYYKMTLLDGKKIDSIVEGTDQPLKFKMTSESLIPIGLRFGSSKMKEGEKFRFFIPSHLAYANYSYGSLFPANSIFIVESKIVKIETENEQKVVDDNLIIDYIADNNIENIEKTTSGLYYKNVTEGIGNNPVIGNTVKIKFVAEYLNGDLFDKTVGSNTFNFIVGNNTVIKGIEEGIKLMKKGETATFILPSHLGYDESLQIFPEIVREDLWEKGLIYEKALPFSILKFDIELVDIL